MDRQWTDNISPDGRRKHARGVAGSEEEEQTLQKKGFQQATSVNGDCYYHNPGRGLVWLFPDGTWYGEKTPQGDSLQEYMDSIPDIEFEEKVFHIVQIEGGQRNNLGPMSGAELYPYVVNRTDSEDARAGLAELDRKGCVKIAYTASFGATGTFEIERVVPRPKAGDTYFYRNGKPGTIYAVAEGAVDISPNRNVAPIPLEHFAPHPDGNPKHWVLVGLDQT
ncbi:MAG TPA: hypothetical protein VKW06_14980 [Candidatus Angelobacter sp.]|nr:hypothetical protein [Candidatus Angelobacter sp.]